MNNGGNGSNIVVEISAAVQEPGLAPRARLLARRPTPRGSECRRHMLRLLYGGCS